MNKIEYLILVFHNSLRWLLLILLILVITLSANGVLRDKKKIPLGQSLNNFTKYTAHLQLFVGLVLYIKRQWLEILMNSETSSNSIIVVLFFSIVHPILMTSSVLMITIGTERSRQETRYVKKHYCTLKWFTLSLSMILMAIPWPMYSSFSRPLLRSFQFLLE